MRLTGQAWHADIGAASWVRFFLGGRFLFRTGPARPFRFSESGFDPTPAPVPETMLSKEIIDSKIEFKFTTHSQIPFTPIITTLLTSLLLYSLYYIYISNFD
jgi:hypothetical protein